MSFATQFKLYSKPEWGYVRTNYRRTYKKAAEGEQKKGYTAEPYNNPIRTSTSPSRIEKNVVAKPKQKEDGWPLVYTPRHSGDSVPDHSAYVRPCRYFTKAHFYDIPTKGKRWYKRQLEDGTLDRYKYTLATEEDNVDQCVKLRKMCYWCEQLLGWEKGDPEKERVEHGAPQDERGRGILINPWCPK